MAGPRLEEHHHTLTVQAPPELMVLGDEVRLAQVFGNLLSNAASYTPDGGRVAVRAEQLDGEIAVSVSDNGRGLAPDIAPRVFELFVQGPRTIDRREGGLGLGLAVARSLVELHGGRIEAFSEGVGRGSTFTVFLPAGVTVAAAPAHPPVPPSTRPLRLLIVDDNPDAAEMLAMFFGGHGHVTVTATDGPQALAALASFAPDIAMLDIGLPVMDGYELARRIRETTGPEGPVLIAITGYGQSEDIQRSRAAGFAHHLVKPVDGDALLHLFSAIAG
jgi:CheY-like chemotaxis protein